MSILVLCFIFVAHRCYTTVTLRLLLFRLYEMAQYIQIDLMVNRFLNDSLNVVISSNDWKFIEPTFGVVFISTKAISTIRTTKCTEKHRSFNFIFFNSFQRWFIQGNRSKWLWYTAFVWSNFDANQWIWFETSECTTDNK